MNPIMNLNGFSARIMEAERLQGENEHGLPPGSPLPVYHTEAFKNHPDSWLVEDGCYVVPVKPDKGLWFDWTGNDSSNSAIIPTVKGCNPITGLKTEGFALERYKNKCPTHGTEFKKDRYCEECGYKWPAQNYITNPNTLWWDGFRDHDGIVRQFFITADMLKDVASNMIGKKNTVPAFGFAFYGSKVVRYPTYEPDGNAGGSFNGFLGSSGIQHIYNTNYTHAVGLDACMPDMMDGGMDTMDFMDMSCDASQSMTLGISEDSNSVKPKGMSFSKRVSKSKSSAPGVSAKMRDMSEVVGPDVQGEFVSNYMEQPKEAEVAIGAGAKITQELIQDPYKLNSWKDDPDSIMRIYFIFEEEFRHWESFGMRDFDGKKDGMLNNIPVG